MSHLHNTIQTYLNKFSDTTKLISEPLARDCRMIVVIPSYRETSLEDTLISLCQCDQTDSLVEIIVILNAPEDDAVGIISMMQTTESGIMYNFMKQGNLRFHFLYKALPAKHAGVGLARKIGMDEAVRRFQETGCDGMIVCLDADCTVSKNYLRELEVLASKPDGYNSACMYFEHDFSCWKTEMFRKLRDGIVRYELFLRYYKEALKWCGFPYAYHTVGSSMAVKCSAYCKAGGMNRRKAGEDFYFLHKVFPYGKVAELNSLAVYPSARISDRVPFGTGRSQMNISNKPPDDFLSYDFEIFRLLKMLCEYDFYSGNGDGLPSVIISVLEENDFHNKLNEIRTNTSSGQQFRKRFFVWLDGFMVLRLVHTLRDRFFPNVKIEDACNRFLSERGYQTIANSEEMLMYFREMQRK